MKVQLKFSVGDKFIREHDNKEFTIALWEVRKNEKGVSISYCFHAYLDKEIDYHQRIPEEELVVGNVKSYPYYYFNNAPHSSTYKCVEPHPAEVELDETDAHGELVELGDNIFSGIYYGKMSSPGCSEGRYVDPRLTFSFYGEVEEFIHTYEHSNYVTEVIVLRRGPCTDSKGNEYHDGRVYGYRSQNHLKASFKHAGETFKDLFVNSFKGRSYERDAVLNKKDHTDDTWWLLDKMEITDEVIERVRKRQYSKNTETKKHVEKKPAKKKTQKPKEVDWEALAKQLAEKSGVDINELIKGKKK